MFSTRRINQFLTPNDAEIFLKYFSEIDRLLSERFKQDKSKNEVFLTGILCELLDMNQSKFHALAYGIEDLNDDLKKSNSLLRVSDLKIDTYEYYPKQENKFTQSDIGIIVNWKNRIVPEHSFEKAVLVQAKKLFPKLHNYTLDSEYSSQSKEQEERIKKLIEKLTGDCFFYLFYNPKFINLPANERERLTYFQTGEDSSHIFDYTYGTHLYNEITSKSVAENISNTGSLFVSYNKIRRLAGYTSGDKLTLKNVAENINLRDSSLPYFFVFNLLCNDGCQDKNLVDFVRGKSTKLIGGDENQTFSPPQYTIEIEITVGNLQG